MDLKSYKKQIKRLTLSNIYEIVIKMKKVSSDIIWYESFSN
jgi:hypothetical protein